MYININLCCVIWSYMMWKSVNLDFGQFSLNLTHWAVPQTDIEPVYPSFRFYTRAVPFVLSSLVQNYIPKNRLQDVTNILTLSSRDATDTHPLSEKWPRDATSKPRLGWFMLGCVGLSWHWLCSSWLGLGYFGVMNVNSANMFMQQTLTLY